MTTARRPPRGPRRRPPSSRSSSREPAGGQAGSAGEADAAIAASVPEGSVAVVEGFDAGEIEREALERRARLVQLRGSGTNGAAARGQALDELIFNRWMRAEAADAGTVFSEEQVSAELASPEFAQEAALLAEAGYDESGIRLDAEARLAAEGVFSDGAPELDVLTAGWDGGSATGARRRRRRPPSRHRLRRRRRRAQPTLRQRPSALAVRRRARGTRWL